MRRSPSVFDWTAGAAPLPVEQDTRHAHTDNAAPRPCRLPSTRRCDLRGGGMTVLRYWAAAKEAAGTATDEVTAGTLAEALSVARERHEERFTTVLERCAFVVDGDPVGVRDHAAVPVRPDSQVDVLPPFAGG
jgi:molybdopterin synthase sulfur carrier subunit